MNDPPSSNLPAALHGPFNGRIECAGALNVGCALGGSRSLQCRGRAGHGHGGHRGCRGWGWCWIRAATAGPASTACNEKHCQAQQRERACSNVTITRTPPKRTKKWVKFHLGVPFDTLPAARVTVSDRLIHVNGDLRQHCQGSDDAQVNSAVMAWSFASKTLACNDSLAPRACKTTSSLDNAMRARACSTVTVAQADTASLRTVTVAMPLLTAVRRPLESTVTTAVSEELQLKGAESVLPFWSLALATSCAVAPRASRVTSEGETEMVVTMRGGAGSVPPEPPPPQAPRTTAPTSAAVPARNRFWIDVKSFSPAGVDTQSAAARSASLAGICMLGTRRWNPPELMVSDKITWRNMVPYRKQ